MVAIEETIMIEVVKEDKISPSNVLGHTTVQCNHMSNILYTAVRAGASTYPVTYDLEE